MTVLKGLLNLIGGKKMFDKFKILRDNWVMIRDEVLSQGLDDYKVHPDCDCSWGKINGIPANMAKPLMVSGINLDGTIKSFPKTWDIIKELELKNIVTVAFSLLQPTGGKINNHKDPEDCFRYHLCLQGDNANIEGTWKRNTISDDFINPGEDVLLLPHSITHSAYNNSEDTVRVHLVIDWLENDGEKKSFSKYRDEFGDAKGWDSNRWVESSNYYHDTGCSTKKPCSNVYCDNSNNRTRPKPKRS